MSFQKNYFYVSALNNNKKNGSCKVYQNNENGDNNFMNPLNNDNNKSKFEIVASSVVQDSYRCTNLHQTNVVSLKSQIIQNKNNEFDDYHNNHIIQKLSTNELRPTKTKLDLKCQVTMEEQEQQQEQGYQCEEIQNLPKLPSIWNQCHGTILLEKCYKSLLSSEEILNNIAQILNQMVEMKYIDWNEIQPFIIEGRIYATQDYAEFRCEIYNLQNDNDRDNDNNNKSMIEFRRIFGDGWIFEEFRTLFLEKLLQNNCIIDGTQDDGFMSMTTVLNKKNIDYNLTNLNDNNDNNDHNDYIFTIDEAKQLLFNAIDCHEEREILRDNLLSLRYAIDDKSKLAKVSQIDNVLCQLLQPIVGENQLYDTWMIKTILEIIFKLMLEQQSQDATSSPSLSSCSSSISSPSLLSSNDIGNILDKIKQQWVHGVEHPLGITTFYPSQQIVRIITNLQQTFIHQ